jgi:hypothetical protein
MFWGIITNHLEIIVLALAGIIFILTIWIIFLQLSLRKIKKMQSVFFTEKDAKNLEGVILQQAQSLKTLDKDIQELYSISNQLNLLASRGLHKTGLIRFNPFKDVGGNQSFSIALLNGKNNGVTISSLYTREGTRIYAKAIKAGFSEKYPLTEEEEQSIKIAMTSEPKKVT